MRGHVNEVVGKVDVVLSRGLENECASVPKTWVGLADQRDDGELKHDMCKGKPAPSNFQLIHPRNHPANHREIFTIDKLLLQTTPASIDLSTPKVFELE